MKQILNRINKLLLKMLSLTFVTWILVSFMYFYNKQQIDMNYLVFTAALIGIKTFKPIIPNGGKDNDK